MARFRVYIKQFNESGEYESDFTEITRDVLKIGNIAQQLDNTSFGIGVFRNSGFSITMNNDGGKYSEANSLNSIFKYKRTDSIIKITWDQKPYDLICGFFNAGEVVLSEELEVFRGLITEVSSASNIKDQSISFSVLGYELLFDRETVPYASVSNGENISTILYTILNQTKITELLAVSALNISVGIDTAIDDKTSLENKTVKEALDELLFLSNSVLRIQDQTVYISNRDASADLEFTFYGQSSINGLENIVDVKNLRDGLNRTFNFWAWDDTSLSSEDATSLDKYGVIKNTISNELIDDASTSKIQGILDEYRDEFAFPKTEMELETPITNESVVLRLLDKVQIDHPPIYVSADGEPLPRYGQDTYGSVVYPYEQNSLVVSSQDRFKIISKRIETQKHTIVFELRKI